jgi:DNA-binding NtrC family response regulator
LNKRGVTHRFLGVPVVAVSRPFRSVLETAQLAARSDAPVLIEGEAGSGKEVLARALHCFSYRCEGPWASLNCVGLPEELAELELFGCGPKVHDEDPNGRPGILELAAGGTLFLDEVSELTPGVQSKFLGVLEGEDALRAGSHRGKADVRVVAATTRNLGDEVRAGRFRSDLYHRLAQFRLEVPPLRDRTEAIVPLAELFLQPAGRELRLTEDAKRALESYPWPGNVSELHRVISECVRMVRVCEIRTLDLPDFLQQHYASLPQAESDLRRLFQTVHEALRSAGGPNGTMLRDMEKRLIQQVLVHTGGHRERAAQLLGISPGALGYKLEEFEERNAALPKAPTCHNR